MTGQDAAEKGVDNQQIRNAAAMSDGAVQKPLRGWRLVGVLSRCDIALYLLFRVLKILGMPNKGLIILVPVSH